MGNVISWDTYRCAKVPPPLEDHKRPTINVTNNRGFKEKPHKFGERASRIKRISNLLFPA